MESLPSLVASFTTADTILGYGALAGAIGGGGGLGDCHQLRLL